MTTSRFTPSANEAALRRRLICAIEDAGLSYLISKDHIVSVLNGDLLYLDGKWTLTPPERDRMRTTLLPHQYDPDATAPGFLQFLDDFATFLKMLYSNFEF